MIKILVIDDDNRFREMFQEMLERKGYQVATATNGVDGLNYFRRNPTNLVITDILMPKKNGIETILEIQKEFPKANIIAISGGGKGKPSDALNGLNLIPKVNLTFQKPFPMRKMLEAVEEIAS